VSIFLRVERGAPDDAELAALIVVLTALATVPGPESVPARSGWADPAWRSGAPVTPGPDAWRLTALPR
jgi:hypothetical protein